MNCRLRQLPQQGQRGAYEKNILQTHRLKNKLMMIPQFKLRYQQDQTGQLEARHEREICDRKVKLLKMMIL